MTKMKELEKHYKESLHCVSARTGALEWNLDFNELNLLVRTSLLTQIHFCFFFFLLLDFFQ